MKRPIESDYTSFVAYARALEQYCDEAEKQEPVCVAFIRQLVSIDKDGIETWKDEPLYISPPKREWQGLTDEEIDEYLDKEWLGYSSYHDCFKEIIKWHEARLKEKNT